MADIRIDLTGLNDLAKACKNLGASRQKMFEACIKELAARLLRKVIKRTPVGVPPNGISKEIKDKYWKGYVGGTLRRGWTAKSEEEAKSGNVPDIVVYLNGVQVKHSGNSFFINIINPVHYASYVEYGHRQTPGRFVPALGKRLKKSFVEGQYMLKISENELRDQAPALIQKKIEKYLKGAFDG